MKQTTRERVFVALCELVDARGYSPQFRELADAAGCSVGNVHHHLHRLRADGRVTFVPGEPRTVRPVREVVTADA